MYKIMETKRVLSRRELNRITITELDDILLSLGESKMPYTDKLVKINKIMRIQRKMFDHGELLYTPRKTRRQLKKEKAQTETVEIENKEVVNVN